MHVDETGKTSFDHIYTEPEPRAYFSTLHELDYCIPQLAKPHFGRLVEEYRETSGAQTPTVLDLGCSYGVNAVLSRCDATMDELYEHYGCGASDRGELLARDRAFVRSRGRSRNVRFLGMDASGPALSYALEAGFIDDAVHADLETRDPTEEEREQLAGADLVISTGCLGYVTEKTISRIVGADGGRRPWMAHFVLRMFPFEPVAEELAVAGYETVRHEGLFRQRRFTTSLEQSLVLDTLSSVGVDPQGLETDGWLYAQLYFSRPARRGFSNGPAASLSDRGSN